MFKSPQEKTISQKFCCSSSVMSGVQIEEFRAPEWVKPYISHASIPAFRVRLAQLPTPVQRFALPQEWIDHDPAASTGKFDVFVKRDDMTGSTLSGNKVRKLEFLLADAMHQRCDVIISAGGIQSNHARTTAVAARELGMEPHMFLRLKTPDQPHTAGSHGNMFLHKMVGTHVHLVPPLPYLTGLLPKMEALKEKLSETRGLASYIIPIGGSNSLGVWGYLMAWDELLHVDNVYERFDDIVLAVGSGGTASGLAIGNYLTGGKVKVHAVSVCDNAEYFHEHCNEMLRDLGLGDRTCSEEILDILDDYKGRGYALNTDEELKFCLQIAQATGVPVDPVYTLKAVLGMTTEMRNNPARFQGRRVLFIHTGGIFGLFDMRMVDHLDHAVVQTWHDERDEAKQ
ncbi:putative D-cysteine desulfhydrase 1, mitochondrial [Porphyridium purpureum]|uniref:Putative D-cysteine desulfhydrase 1, mitochondrial n=1 Tax=Porphyridium purpureum TaxID=35688 RepID=A0A5J4Z619_PORPP|nr:putative D-cysteine desulfhydrase 1, mitochondrial [Porphyridium purpureum]|eukprot:POR1079..scf295_1